MTTKPVITVRIDTPITNDLATKMEENLKRAVSDEYVVLVHGPETSIDVAHPSEQIRLLKSIDRNLEILITLQQSLIDALADEGDGPDTGGYDTLSETEPQG